MKNKTLVILAGGMGSRFGSLKQVEPLGLSGEFIIDYSIYDAIKAGFDKVVFIIKKENYDIFRNTIGKRIEGKIKVEYVFQDNSHVPSDITIPEERGAKPLGTGDAILFCEDVVNEPFLIINADDFYGSESYHKAMEFIKNNKDENNYGVIGYRIGNTLTENGSVKRGIIKVVDNKLDALIESKCILTESGVLCSPLSGDEPFYVSENSPVSMNMFVFYPNYFELLKKDIEVFFRNNDLAKAEFLVPDIVFDHLKKKDRTCELVESGAVWKGVTYLEDLDEVKNYIKELIERGVYPVDLYK
jgi:dTDP-glucose pyrophosphorylase